MGSKWRRIILSFFFFSFLLFLFTNDVNRYHYSHELPSRWKAHCRVGLLHNFFICISDVPFLFFFFIVCLGSVLGGDVWDAYFWFWQIIFVKNFFLFFFLFFFFFKILFNHLSPSMLFNMITGVASAKSAFFSANATRLSRWYHLNYQ